MSPGGVVPKTTTNQNAPGEFSGIHTLSYAESTSFNDKVSSSTWLLSYGYSFGK